MGKTSLLYLLIKYLMSNGFSPDKIHFYDLEDEFVRMSFEGSYGDVIRFLQTEGVDRKNRHFVFLDEIQYLEDPSPTLKLIHDHHPNIKLIVSGSSSLAIEKKWSQSLAGRFVEFQLHPLNFREFLNFKDIDLRNYRLTLSELIDKANERFRVPPAHENLLKNLWREYVIWGGLPGVVLLEDFTMKERLLHSYISSYVMKDIVGLLKSTTRFVKLLQLIAAQSSNLLNLNELSRVSAIPRSTLENYISVLEASFIVNLIRPFKRNPSTEIVKMPKIYFFDNGVRNGLIGIFSQPEAHPLSGQLMENAIFTNLNTKGYRVNFWRSKSGQEVDFVLQINGNLVAIEVKQGEVCPPHIPGGIRSFIKSYAPNISIIFNDRCLTCMPDKRICYLPHWTVGWIEKSSLR